MSELIMISEIWQAINSPPSLFLILSCCIGVVASWQYRPGTIVALSSHSVGKSLSKAVISIVNPPIPSLPYHLPILKHTISFLFHGPWLFCQISKLFPKAPVVRVETIRDDIYIVQGPKHVSKLLGGPNLAMTRAYGLALKHVFGMRQKAVDVYTADTSGSRPKPISGSNVSESARIIQPTHEILVNGLLGDGLEGITARLQKAFAGSLAALQIHHEWVHLPDLTEFLEQNLGGAIVRSVFGPLLLQQKDFLRDLFEYDDGAMTLARRTPWFLAPTPHRTRRRLIEAVKNWHRLAFKRCGDGDHSNTSPDELELPWGCKMMQERYQTLSNLDGQDEDAVASADLGLVWASVTNIVPSSVTAVANVFNDTELLTELRESLEPISKSESGLQLQSLDKLPLLQSIYAEALRFGVQIYIPRCAPYHTTKIGMFTVPRDKLILANTYLAHNDDDVWNSQEGKHPLRSFWGKRFLIDPENSLRGPCKSGDANPTPTQHSQENGARFSVGGLEGSWIPYGGGHLACPGRLLAKRIMLLSLSTMVSAFDVELQVPLEFASPRYGFGVQKPAGKLPLRIRRRVQDD